MRAIRIHSFGGPQVLTYEEAPVPEPAAGEVLIRVRAAGVNPIDWKVRQGMFGERRLPLIPGWDVSGVIEKAGEGVTGFSPGDEVYSLLDRGRDGCYAQFAASDAAIIAAKPVSIDHIHAAAVPLAGLAAWQSLFDLGGLSPGQRILIHGSAGGLGHYAVQYAKWKGAYVIGTASAADAAFVKSLGADEVIDYQATRFEDVVKETDVVFDVIGGDTQERSWQVLRKGGVLVSTLGIASPEKAEQLGVEAKGLMVQSDTAQLTEIAGLIDAGIVRPRVQSVMPLADAAEAHELVQAGKVHGKLVLEVED
ncbi:MAG: NADP-dependent oxidoreductase [Actinobacteria bacterium]|nr:NADP-dependent oxidoreductase [Actinomycetota bacterium]MCL5883447.1 NADP-dependent oxidoreductase [Actinomycetota bacterium]